MTPRDLLRTCFDAAIAAADPEAAVRASLTAEPLDLTGVRRVIVVGAGKATAPMTLAIEQALGDRISGGVIVVKHGHALPLTRVTVHEGGHPVPDVAGAAGAQALLEAVADLQADDLVIACISGGASALLPAPRSSLTLADLQEVNQELLVSGAPIAAMNAVRKHLSCIAGGQLACAAAPARIEAFILSDVIGDDLSTIASGPTVGDPSTFADVTTLLAEFGVRVPAAVQTFLQRGRAGDEAETPKPGDPVFARVRNRLVGSNALALAAAATAGRAAGCTVTVIDEAVVGEATAAAERFCRHLVTLAAGHRGPHLLLAGGEPTVTLGEASGLGGRAQEFAAACIGKLAGHDDLHVLAAGTDGSDGPTDAAGGFADGTGARRAEFSGVDPRAALVRHDAYPLLKTLGDLLVTGPTRTNVMDVYMGFIATGPEVLH